MHMLTRARALEKKNTAGAGAGMSLPARGRLPGARVTVARNVTAEWKRLFGREGHISIGLLRGYHLRRGEPVFLRPLVFHPRRWYLSACSAGRKSSRLHKKKKKKMLTRASGAATRLVSSVCVVDTKKVLLMY